MPKFIPVEEFKDQDVYVVMGGRSVASLDLDALKDKPVIGMNQAFCTPLSEILNYCVFGDTLFIGFVLEKLAELKAFKGEIVTNAAMPCGVDDYDWLLRMDKVPFMEKGKNLGWYGNTGILGIELAITLGAKRVYLLGCDNYNEDGESHYHNYHKGEVSNRALKMFNKQYERANTIWKQDFPEVEVVNLNPKSNINSFKKMSGLRHLKGLTNGC